MLDMGFIVPIRKVVAALGPERQTLFFSATMPKDIRRLAGELLDNPREVSVTPEATTVERVEQRVMFVDAGHKPALLAELLADKAMRRALVFTRTKRGADKVARGLGASGINAEAIHGNKIPVPAPESPGRVQGGAHPGAGGHRRGGARHRRGRRHPRGQLRAAQRARELCPPHRPHRAGGCRRYRHFVLRFQRARAPSRHRGPDPSAPGDRGPPQPERRDRSPAGRRHGTREGRGAEARTPGAPGAPGPPGRRSARTVQERQERQDRSAPPPRRNKPRRPAADAPRKSDGDLSNVRFLKPSKPKRRGPNSGDQPRRRAG